MAFYHERAAFYSEGLEITVKTVSSQKIIYTTGPSLEITFKTVSSPKISHEMGSSRVITFEMDSSLRTNNKMVFRLKLNHFLELFQAEITYTTSSRSKIM